MLEVLAAAGQGVSLTEVSRRTGLAYSTTYRILETLRRRQHVYQDATSGTYAVGLKAFQVGSGFVPRRLWQHLANASMKELAASLGESVSLCVLDGTEAVYVHQVEGRSLIRMSVRIGTTAPLHASSVGKVLLAWRGEDEIRGLVGAGPLEAFTDSTILRPDALIESLTEVAEKGYACEHSELEQGVSAIGVPIRDPKGEVVAAMSVAGPTTRFGEETLSEFAARLTEAARQVQDAAAANGT